MKQINLALVLEKDKYNYKERLVKRTNLTHYAIDTADSSDCGYETAICRIGVLGQYSPWRIVEYYSDKMSAREGHKKWVDFVKKNQPKKIYDVQLEEEVIL